MVEMPVEFLVAIRLEGSIGALNHVSGRRFCQFLSDLRKFPNAAVTNQSPN